MTITATGCDPTYTHDQVYSTLNSNLTTIATQTVIATAAVTFPGSIGTSTYAGGAVASVTGGVTVTTNNDKTGYSLTGNDSMVVNSGTVVSYTSPNPTLTLASSAANQNGYYVGCLLRIVSGPGAGQSRVIIAQTGQVVNPDSAFKTVPTSSSTYAIYANRSGGVDSFGNSDVSATGNPLGNSPVFPALDANGNVHVSATAMRPAGTL